MSNCPQRLQGHRHATAGGDANSQSSFMAELFPLSYGFEEAGAKVTYQDADIRR